MLRFVLLCQRHVIAVAALIGLARIPGDGRPFIGLRHSRSCVNLISVLPALGYSARPVALASSLMLNWIRRRCGSVLTTG